MEIIDLQIARHYLKIVGIRQEAPYTYSYDLEMAPNLDWEAGTNIHVSVKAFDPNYAFDHKQFVRHMSAVTLPSEGKLTITTRISENPSVFKSLLKEKVVGDTLEVFKFSNRMPLIRQDKPIVLITAGVGVATVRPLVKAFMTNSSGIPEMTHLHIDSKKAFIFGSELNQWAQENDRFRNLQTSDRPTFYAQLETLSQKQNAYFYVVGSDEFLLNIRENLISRGVSTNLILFDKKQKFYNEHHIPYPEK